MGSNETESERGDELRKDEQSHEVPLRQPESERPPGHGQGEAAGLSVRRVGHSVEAWRSGAQELSDSRTLQTEPLSLDKGVKSQSKKHVFVACS